MGFGTGLNCLLTYNWFSQNRTSIYYAAVEKYPLLKEDITSIYTEIDNHHISKLMHDAHWNNDFTITEGFTLIKLERDIKNAQINPDSFDLVYYDAFGPSTQPELWSLETLSIIHNLMKPKGVLVTYCAQGQFKRNLKTLNFELESLPGPPGKREMTRAIKTC